MLKKVLICVILPLLAITCEKNQNRVNFKNYPADYKIAYFEEMEIKNIPSVKDLFGKYASYNDDFRGTPVTVITESYESDKHDFSVDLVLRVIETEYDIVRMNLRFEADEETKISFLKDFKIESLLSGQIIEKKSDGSREQDIETFGYFINYMEMFWK